MATVHEQLQEMPRLSQFVRCGSEAEGVMDVSELRLGSHLCDVRWDAMPRRAAPRSLGVVIE
jgi:hypothetical protein